MSTTEYVYPNWLAYDDAVAAWRSDVIKSGNLPTKEFKIKLEFKDFVKTTIVSGVTKPLKRKNVVRNQA